MFKSKRSASIMHRTAFCTHRSEKLLASHGRKEGAAAGEYPLATDVFEYLLCGPIERQARRAGQQARY